MLADRCARTWIRRAASSPLINLCKILTTLGQEYRTAAKSRIRRRIYKPTGPTSRLLLRQIFTRVLMASSVPPTCKQSCLPNSTRCSISGRRPSTWPALRRQRARSVSRSMSSGYNSEITAADPAASHAADHADIKRRKRQVDPVLLVSAQRRASEQADASSPRPRTAWSIVLNHA